MSFIERLRSYFPGGGNDWHAKGATEPALEGQRAIAAEKLPHDIPPALPTRRRAVYQRYDTYLSDLITQVSRERRYILDQNFAYKRDERFFLKYRREPAIGKAVWTRQTNVVGNGWHLEEADEESAALTPIFEALIKKIKGFQGMLIRLSHAFWSGDEWEKLLSRYENADPGKDGVQARWWVIYGTKHHNRDRFHVEWQNAKYNDGSERRHWYWAMANPYTYRTELLSPQELEGYIHHVWLDMEEFFGRGYGLSDSLAIYWELKQLFVKYLGTGLERFAWPWIIAKTDEESEPYNSSQGAPFTTSRLILEKINKMRQAGVLVIDAADEITTLDLGTGGNALILSAIDYLDKMSVEYILGASAQVGGHGEQAQGGAYASDAVEADSADAYIGYDRQSLEETITAQVIERLWRYNRAHFQRMGLAHLTPPKFKLGLKKKDDPLMAIQEVALMTQAVPSWEFRKSQVEERVGWDFATNNDREKGDVIGGATGMMDPLMMTLGAQAPESIDPRMDEGNTQGEAEEGSVAAGPEQFSELRKGARAQRMIARPAPKRLGMTRDEIMAVWMKPGNERAN